MDQEGAWKSQRMRKEEKRVGGREGSIDDRVLALAVTVVS